MPLTLVQAGAPPAEASAEPPALPKISVRTQALEERADGPVHGLAARRSVTGTKTDTPLLEIPQSLSIITREELLGRGAGNIKEAVAYSAGVTVSPSLDLREDLLTLRGFPFDWAAFFLDGLQMPSTTYAISSVEPYGLERVELLKGPASMLFGQSSTGGLVNMVSKRPQPAPQGELRLSVGSHGLVQLAGDVSGLLDERGHWSYRLVGLKQKSGTQVEFIRGDRLYLAPSLRWAPSADTELLLLASVMDDDAGGTGATQAFLPAAGIALPHPAGKVAVSTYGGEPGYDRYLKKQHSAGYNFGHTLRPGLRLEQQLRYRKVSVDTQALFGQGYAASDPQQRTLERAAFASIGDNRSLSLDNRLLLDAQAFSLQHRLLLGLDWRKGTLDEMHFWGDAPSIDIFAPRYGAAVQRPPTPYANLETEFRQLGLYVQDQVRPSPDWLLTLGLRHDRASARVQQRSDGAMQRQDDRKGSARLGLSYLGIADSSIYLSAASSFNPTLGTDFGGKPFVPRTGRQLEAGFKHLAAGGRLSLQGALFQLTQSKSLTADPDPSHPNAQVQTGAYRSRGLELEAKGLLAPGWELLAAYTRLNARISKSNEGNVGNAARGIPRHAGSLWLAHTPRQWPGLTLGAGVRHVGERPSSDALEHIKMAPMTTLDASLSYRFADYELQLSGSNLGNRIYADCWPGNQCWYTVGRSLRASLSSRW